MTGRPLLLLVSSPLIWFAHFSVLYGTAGFGGALGVAPNGIRAVNWSATLVSATAVVAVLVLSDRNPRRSGQASHAMREMAGSLAALSLWAVVIEALVLWIIPQ